MEVQTDMNQILNIICWTAAEKVFRQLDSQAIYANTIAVKTLKNCKIPRIVRDGGKAAKMAVKILRER